MAHAQPWMAALLNVTRRSAESEDQKFPEPLLGFGKVASRIHGTKDVIVGNLSIKRGDQAYKAFFTDKSVDFALFQQADAITGNRSLRPAE